jgi:N-acetylglucosamine kinase-like BadF-type ATPase
MMIIADSGSTKTHWKLLDNKSVIAEFSTQGLNP